MEAVRRCETNQMERSCTQGDALLYQKDQSEMGVKEEKRLLSGSLGTHTRTHREGSLLATGK